MTQYPEAWLCRELGMAVVNIALITDYDAGVLEGTEAVDALIVARGLRRRTPTRIQQVVLDMIGRFPADLDALGARGAARVHPRRRPRDRRPRTSACSRRGSERDRPPTGGRRCRSGSRCGSIRAEPRLVARERAAARRRRLRGRLGAGTTSSARAIGRCRSSRAGRSSRWRPARRSRVTVGPFVLNVMNRHPAVLARMALDAPDRERRPADPRDRDRRRAEGARGLRHRVPEATERVGPARGGGRRDPRALDRRPGDARRRRSTRSRTRTRIPVPTRRRRSSSAARRRPGRGWPAGSATAGAAFDDNFESEPAGLPRGPRGVGPAARGPAASTSGSRATGSATPTSRRARGCRAPRESWERWRDGRRRRGDRASPGRPRTSTRSWRPPNAGRWQDCPPDDRRRPPPRDRPRPTPASAAARRCRSTSACARSCNPLGLRDVASSQAHGTVFVGIGVAVVVADAGRRCSPSGDRAVPGRRSSRSSPTVTGSRVSLVVKNEGTSLGSTTCRISDPTSAAGQSAIVQSPRIAAGRDADLRRDGDGSAARLAEELIAECSSP